MDEFDDIVLDDYAFDTNEPSTELPEQSTSATPNSEDPKKVIKIKFDETLLLETKGLPLLRNESQYIRFQGNGHEAADLKRLMTYYTIWANNLYPKLRFKDFARKVGTQASKSRVKVVVEQWQNEYKDRLQARRDAANELSGETVGEEDGSYRREEAESSDDDNRPLFIPLSKEAEEALAKKRKAKTTSRNPRKQYRSSDMINSEDDDDDDEEVDSSSRKEPPRTITFSDSEDEEDDMVIKKKAKTSSANSREQALALLAKKRAKSQSTSANGREHALAILAEKKKQRLLAQKRLQEQEEEEEQKENIIEQEESSDEDIDFDEQLRNIMSGKSSSKSKNSNSTDGSTKAQDKAAPSIYDDIEMEDIGDIDLDTIEMEDVEDDVLNNDDST